MRESLSESAELAPFSARIPTTRNGTFSSRMYCPMGLGTSLRTLSRTFLPITATAAAASSSAWLKKLPCTTGQLKMAGKSMPLPPVYIVWSTLP